MLIYKKCRNASRETKIQNWQLDITNCVFRWMHIYIITRSKVHIRDTGWTIKSGTPDDDIAENDDRMIRIYPLAMTEGSTAYRADCQTYPSCQGEGRRGWQRTVRWESAISVSTTHHCQGGRANHYMFAYRLYEEYCRPGRELLQACNNSIGQRDFTERTKVFCIAGLPSPPEGPPALHKGQAPTESGRPSSKIR